ncbi:MAG: hypothetical protein GWN87_02220, partial [Desulfuromonadales bacterium]|nr:hypothetical protein [Desulfuromonadales bacterium]
MSEPFSIDTIALIDPNGSELVVSGNTYTVTWTIEYAPSAVRAGAWYRFEGESDWHAIGSTAAIDSRIDWTLPAVSEETRAYVGLVLYDATGSP